jgi:hypothetical protein
MSGVDAARELKYIGPNVPVTLYSAYADAFRGRQVLPEGVSEVERKEKICWIALFIPSAEDNHNCVQHVPIDVEKSKIFRGDKLRLH